MSELDVRQIIDSTFITAVDDHDSIDSTNDRALSLASEQAIGTPLLITTERQTGGRGRGTNRWWCGEGALAFSLVTDRPEMQLLPRMSLTIGLAVCEGLASVWPPGSYGLKWPNDVYLNGRKICGVLIEQPSGDQHIVIGVGINLNNSFRQAPNELKSVGVSLCDEIGSTIDRTEVLIAVLQSLEDHLQALASPQLPALWRHRCLLAGEQVCVTINQREFCGRCLGIADDASLTIETDSGRRSIFAGSVRLLDRRR